MQSGAHVGLTNWQAEGAGHRHLIENLTAEEGVLGPVPLCAGRPPSALGDSNRVGSAGGPWSG